MVISLCLHFEQPAGEWVVGGERHFAKVFCDVWECRWKQLGHTGHGPMAGTWSSDVLAALFWFHPICYDPASFDATLEVGETLMLIENNVKCVIYALELIGSQRRCNVLKAISHVDQRESSAWLFEKNLISYG